MKVLKYVMPEFDEQAIPVYEPFKVLSVGIQERKIVIWALGDLESDKIAKRFHRLDTGQDIPDDAGEYYGTITDDNGYVTHVFEKT